MIKDGHSNIVAGFFVPIAMVVCDGQAPKLFDTTYMDMLMDPWAEKFSPSDRKAHARASLKVLPSLSPEQKEYIELLFKTALEREYLFREPDIDYVQAMLKGGKLVHIPLWCTACKAKWIVEKKC